MDLAQLATNPELLTSWIDGVTFEPWKQLTGEASTIAISSISSSQVIVLKNENLARLAYPLNLNYKRGGKIRSSFAINTKTATQLLKIESALKDRLGSSGMMKKTDIKSMHESMVNAPSPKYPSHIACFDVRVDAPKTALYQQIENPDASGWSTVPINFDDIAKFSLMSLRIAPTLVWKGNGKMAIKFMLKQAVVAYEEEIPPPVDEANIDIQWDELEDDEFLEDLASQSSKFTADKLVPKNLKGAKGAKASGADEEFSAVSKPKPEAKAEAKPKKVLGKKKAAEPSGDDVDQTKEEEEVIAFGLAEETPNGKAPPKAKKPPQKRAKVQKIDPSEIPQGKIDLPSAGDAMMDEMAEEEGDESED